MALEVASQMGEPKLVEFAEQPASMPVDRYVVGNVEKLKQAIGYTPEFELTETVTDTIDYIRSLK